MTSLTDPARLRAVLEDAARVNAELAPLTTASAQDPVGRLRDAVTALRSALDPVGYDITKLPPALLTRLQGPEVTGALAALDNAAQGC